MSAEERRAKLVRVAPALIVVLALCLRLCGINWDGGYRFHPDERQILFVADRLQFPWPPDPSLFTPSSSWNPGFFAYGSLPIYLLYVAGRIVALVSGNPVLSLSELAIVGRVLSAFFDVGSVYLIYRIGDKVYDRVIGILGALLTAVTVLHVQLAHFYAVDTVLTFFALLTLFQALKVIDRGTPRAALELGLALGAAGASKVSAAPLVLTVLLVWLVYARRACAVPDAQSGWRGLLQGLRPFGGFVLTGIIALVTFVLLEPYAVMDFYRFAADIVGESFMARGVSDVPYTRQYINTPAYLYILQQSLMWGMGLPLGLAALAGWIAALLDLFLQMWRKRCKTIAYRLIPLSWALVYFALVGSFHAKFLRYMLPITALLALWASWGLCSLYRSVREHPFLRYIGAGMIGTIVLSGLLYACAYVRMYHQRHPWIATSRWICSEVPQPSVLMIEHWDHTLPLLQGAGDVGCNQSHEFFEFPAYDADDPNKERILLRGLLESDYIVIASQRLYGTIPRISERYPMTTRYYQLLMAEDLGYELVHFASRYPNMMGVRLVDQAFSEAALPIPAALAKDWQSSRTLVLGKADESYSVYDHPLPLVFEKKEQFSLERLQALFGDTLPSSWNSE